MRKITALGLVLAFLISLPVSAQAADAPPKTTEEGLSLISVVLSDIPAGTVVKDVEPLWVLDGDNPAGDSVGHTFYNPFTSETEITLSHKGEEDDGSYIQAWLQVFSLKDDIQLCEDTVGSPMKEDGSFPKPGEGLADGETPAQLHAGDELTFQLPLDWGCSYYRLKVMIYYPDINWTYFTYFLLHEDEEAAKEANDSAGSDNQDDQNQGGAGTDNPGGSDSQGGAGSDSPGGSDNQGGSGSGSGGSSDDKEQSGTGTDTPGGSDSQGGSGSGSDNPGGTGDDQNQGGTGTDTPGGSDSQGGSGSDQPGGSGTDNPGSSSGEAGSQGGQGFFDVPPDAFFSEAVAWAVSRSIVLGTDDNLFIPNASCSRAQILFYLWKGFGSPEPTVTTCDFPDVKEDDYYWKAVLWASEKKILKGNENALFGPDDLCSRAQAVTLLYRANECPIGALAAPFKDMAANSWYTDAVNWAYEQKITLGTGGNCFTPDRTCTRGEIVTLLHRGQSVG